MRTLCLLLILANVLYFTWSQMIDVYVPNLERKGAKPVEPPARIVLAREMIEANPEERSVGPIREVLPPASSSSRPRYRVVRLRLGRTSRVEPTLDQPRAILQNDVSRCPDPLRHDCACSTGAA